MRSDFFEPSNEKKRAVIMGLCVEEQKTMLLLYFAEFPSAKAVHAAAFGRGHLPLHFVQWTYDAMRKTNSLSLSAVGV